MAFNAVKAYRDLKEKYVRFLLDRTVGAFPNSGEDERWNKIRTQLENTWKNGSSDQSLFAPPVLEGLFPYQPCGKTITELVDDGTLHPDMIQFVDPKLADGTYQLYVHQLAAISASKEKNIIVASGTGSGKTECFLYSMINNLLNSGDDLKKRGVRILLIYPMNALVKDQLKRIVNMVKGKGTEISVGMYTGQTPESGGSKEDWEKDAQGKDLGIEYYTRTRRDIRDNPPHILITNYSMLEYMMLRQKDNKIFETGKLQAIVLDEAHLYTGTLGNDINMLLRRVINRFRPENPVRFYATSATIGDNSEETLKNAAAGIFNCSPEEVEAITGSPHPEDSNDIPDWQATREAKEAAVALKNRLLNPQGGEPRNFIQLSNGELDTLDAIPLDSKDENGKKFLPYKLHAFVDSPRYYYTDLAFTDDLPLGNLRNNPFYADRTGIQVFTCNMPRKDFYFKAKCAIATNDDDEQTITIVSAEKSFFQQGENQTALKTVYFRFRSALDADARGFNLIFEAGSDSWRVEDGSSDNPGVFVLARDKDNLASWNNLGKWHTVNGEELKEFAGQVSDDEDTNAGITEATQYRGTTAMMMPLGFVARKLRALMLSQILFPHLPPAENDPQQLTWHGKQLLFFSDSRGNAANMAVWIQNDHQKELIKNYIYQTIALCGKNTLQDICSDMIAREELRAQIALPQCCYDDLKAQERYNMRNPAHPKTDIDLGYWKEQLQFPALVFQEIAVGHNGERSLEGQGAIQVRLAENVAPDPSDELVDIIAFQGTRGQKIQHWKNVIFPDLVDIFRFSRKVYMKQLAECENSLARNKEDADNRRLPQSVRQDAKATIKLLKYDLRILWNALRYLYSDLRGNGMFLNYPPEQSARWNEFLEKYFRVDTQNRTASLGAIRQTLWVYLCNCNLTVNEDANGYGNALFIRRQVDDNCCISLNPEKLRFVLKADNQHVFADNATNRITIAENAPEGTREVTISDSADYHMHTDNRNYRLHEIMQNSYIFSAEKWGGLRVPEHSAQLDVGALSLVEESFQRHEINIISCTPTLEVGVDIGGLSTVIQANLPPQKANYLQRAGRAGRRQDPSALNLTMVGDSLYDSQVTRDSLSIFKRDNLFHAADVSLPAAKTQIRQHIQQFFLEEFFRGIQEKEQARNQGENQENEIENPVAVWESVGNLFAARDKMEFYKTYLDGEIAELLDTSRRKHQLEEQLRKINLYLQNGQNGDTANKVQNFQEILSDKLNQPDFRRRLHALVAGTCCENENFQAMVTRLAKVLNDCAKEVNLALTGIQAQWNPPKGYTDDQKARYRKALRRQYNNLYSENVIAFLVHKRIIPAYGFPIDVVSFHAGDHTIERDVFTTINEFVPESQLTIEHEKFSVDALTADIYQPDQGMYKPFFIYTCNTCHFKFMKENGAAAAGLCCPNCGSQIAAALDDNQSDNETPPPEDAQEQPEQQAALNAKIWRVVAPKGYRSYKDSRDAAGSFSGRVWCKTDDLLLLPAEKLKGIRLQDHGQPAPAKMFLLTEEDQNENGDNVSPEVVRINHGSYCYGYLIDNTTGEIISKNRDADINAKWREHRDNVVTAHLACHTRCSVWICAIPAYDDQIKRKPLQTLISIALQKEACEQLKVDSRTLPSYITPWGNNDSPAILFCLYDVSGTNNLLQQVKNRELSILENALKRITGCETRTDCFSSLLSYQNAADIADISDADFLTAKQWIDDHEDQIVNGVYKNLNGFDVATVQENPLAHPGESVTLLIKNFSDAYCLEGKLIDNLLKANCPQVNVLFDEKSLPEVPLNRWKFLEYLMILQQQNSRLHFHTADFGAGPVSGLYEKSIRFAVGNHWYMVDPTHEEAACDLSFRGGYRKIYEIQNPNIEFNFDACPAIRNEENPPTEERDAEIFWVNEFDDDGKRIIFNKFSETGIWKNCGLNPAEMTVQEITYEDPYFHTPANWKTLLLLLREFKFAANAKIMLYTEINREDARLFELYGPVENLFCSQPIYWDIKKTDAPSFADLLELKLNCNVNIQYCDPAQANEKLDHGRYMGIKYLDENNKEQEVTVIFDKGLAFLRFIREQTRLFSDYARFSYSGNYSFACKKWR